MRISSQPAARWPWLGSFLLALTWATASWGQVPPEAPTLSVKAFILMDAASGQTLAESAADERLEPASITKIMTAYVVYRAIARGDIRATDQVAVSERAWKTGGSRMFIEVGSRVSVDDLLMGLVVQSGNDAAVALAEHVAGSEEAFAVLMNQVAGELGLKNSNFMNASGLSHPDHGTSVRDIALLVRALIRQFPEQYTRYSVKEFTYPPPGGTARGKPITQQNRNQLLFQDPTVAGGKTGHTSSAGYCLAASAVRDNMRLISVIFGAESVKSRFEATQTLLNHGYRHFETRELFTPQQPVTETRVWFGTQAKVALGVATPVALTLPKGRGGDVQTLPQVPASLDAPIEAGKTYGLLQVKLGNQVYGEVPLVALTAVESAGWLGQIHDGAWRWVYSWFE